MTELVTLEEAAQILESHDWDYQPQPELADLVRAADDVVKAALDVANDLCRPNAGQSLRCTPQKYEALSEALAAYNKISRGEAP